MKKINFKKSEISKILVKILVIHQIIQKLVNDLLDCMIENI